MTTEEKLNKRRDELASEIMFNVTLGPSYKDGFNTLAPSWLKLEAALKDLFAMIDEGLLVRDISKDHESDYHQRMIKLVSRLHQNSEALAEADKFLEGK